MTEEELNGFKELAKSINKITQEAFVIYEVQVDRIYRNKIKDEKEITDIYLIPFSYPFLITNYCNKTYDTFLDKLHFLPESIIHGLLILAGKSYTFEFPKNEVN